MKRQQLCLAIVLVLCLLLSPLTASAAEVASGTCGDNVTWSLDDTGQLTISGTGPMGDYSGKNSAAANYGPHAGSINTVVIQPGITRVGTGAFYRQDYGYDPVPFSSLQTVQIPNTVETIGILAFNQSSVENVTIPFGVRSIEERAFCKSGITNIVIPDSVTSIGAYQFYQCSSLESVTLPDKLTVIPTSMFYQCSKLATLNYGGALESIASGSFRSTALNNLTLTVKSKDTPIGSSAFQLVPGTVTIYGEAGGSVESNASSYGYTFATAVQNFTFDANGGSGTAMAPMSVTFDGSDKGDFPACTFTNGGKVFTGWNTKADGNGISVEDGSPVQIVAASGDVTLYAQWADPSLTVAGTLITDSNKDDVLGDGSVRFSGSTLTLNGFAAAGFSGDPVIDVCMDDLTIKLEGNNAIICDQADYGIYSTNGITFTGSGRLAINGGKDAIHAGSLTASSSFTGTLVLQGGNTAYPTAGLAANTVNIQGGTVLATGGFSSDHTYGVKGDVTVSGGVLYAQGGIMLNMNGSSYGIYGNASVSGGALIARAGLIQPNGTSYADDKYADAGRRAVTGTLTTGGGATVAGKVGYSTVNDKSSYSDSIPDSDATGIFVAGSSYSSVDDLPASITGDIYNVKTALDTYFTAAPTEISIADGKTALFVNLVENGENNSNSICGMSLTGSSLSISGGGKLIGIGGTAVSYSYCYGISINSGLTVSDTDIIAVAGPSKYSNYGMYIGGTLTIPSGSVTGMSGQSFYDYASYGARINKIAASGTGCVLGAGGNQYTYYSYGLAGTVETYDEAQVFGISGSTANYSAYGIDGTAKAYGGVIAGLSSTAMNASEGFEDGFYCYPGARVVGLAAASSTSNSSGAWSVAELGGTVVLAGHTSAVYASGSDHFPVGDWCGLDGYSDPAGTSGKTNLDPETETYTSVNAYKRLEISQLGEPYDLWVGGVHVLSTNKDDITAAINAKQPGAASGTAVYTPAAGSDPAKLELTNFSFSGTGFNQSWNDSYRTYNSYSVIYAPGDLEIVLTGDNTLTETSAEPANGRSSYGIYRYVPYNDYGPKPTLTISGSGTLTAYGADVTLTEADKPNYTAGIYIESHLIINDTASVTGYGGDVNVAATPCSFGWTFGKEVRSFGVYSLDTTVAEGASLTGYGGDMTLTDNLGDDGACSRGTLDGDTFGVVATFKNSAGTVQGTGGSLNVASTYAGTSGQRGIKAQTIGVWSGSYNYTDCTSDVSGPLSAAGGALTTSIPDGSTRNTAASAGLMQSYYGSFTYSGEDLTLSGDTMAISSSSTVSTSYSTVHTILKNTANTPAGAEEGTIATGSIPMSDGTQSYKYISISKPYSVTVTLPEHAYRDTGYGDVSQYVAKGGSIEDIIIKSDDGYYFPTDYSVAPVNGIGVTRDSYTQITVSGAPTSEAAISISDPLAKTKEDTPAAIFTAAGADSGTLTGVTAGMTYSIDTGAPVSITGTSVDLTGLAPCTIKVIQPSTDTNTKLDSDAQEISVTRADAPTAPSAAGCTNLSDNDGKITGVSAAMEYKKSDAAAWTAGTGSDITGLVPGTYYVRVKAAGTVLTSDNQELTVDAYVPGTFAVTVTPGDNMTIGSGGAATQYVTEGNSMTAVVYTANDGYYFPTDYTVTPVNGVGVTRDSYTQITVSGMPSANAGITLTAPAAKVKEATPAAAFTATGTDTGTLSGVTAGMTYAINTGTPVSITGTSVDLTGLSACTIKVIQPSTDANTRADSDPQEISVTKASAPAGISAAACTDSNDNDGKISGVTTAMEYMKSDDTAWTIGTGSDITGLVPGTYYVRVKAAGTALTSDNRTLTIASYTAPSSDDDSEPALVTEINTGNSITGSNLDRLISRNKTLSVTGEDGTKAVLNTEALKGIDKATSGKVTLTLTDVTEEHRDEYPESTVYTLTITSDGKEVDDFGGEVTLTIPRELGEKENPRRLSVQKEGADGELQMLDAGYDREKGEITLTDEGSTATYVVTYKPFPFVDVADESYYYDAVDWADLEGITEGTSPTTFSPLADATRGQTITFLWRAAGCPEPASKENPFTDVPGNAYFYKAVLWALENGITDGTSAEHFSPNATVTRAQVATFLYRMGGKAEEGVMPFVDVEDGSYYEDAVLWAYKNGVTEGTSATKFSPADHCLRGQIVTFLYRYFK